jgi:ABC-2 type transport system ATP-binding protein
MCDRALVLVEGRLGFDGPVDEGIRFLKYDDGPEDDAMNQEEDLGADI